MMIGSPARVLLALLCCASLLTPCASAQQRPELQKIVVSQSGAGDPTFYAPYYVAQAKGFFREEGLEVSADGVPGIQELAQILGGQAQLTALTSTSIIAASKGRYLPTIAGVTYQWALDLVLSNAAIDKLHVSRSDPIAKRVEDLRGLRLGITAVGSTTEIFTRYVLLRYGMQPDKDVTLVTLGSCTTMMAALQKGDIDGYWCGPPGPEQAEGHGLGKVIISGTAGDVPEARGALYSGYYARPDFIAKNPRTVQAFVNAIAKALAFIHQHPAEAEAITHAVNPNYDPALAKTSFETYLKAFAMSPVVALESMVRAVDIMKVTTPATAQVDPKKLVDNSFAERAVH